MIKLHGTFNLKHGITSTEFQAVLDAFCAHLKSKRLVTDWWLVRRAPHAGYDREPPMGSFYLSIDFPDMDVANACYAYVAADREPLHSLHKAVHSRIDKTSTSFFTTDDV